MCIDCSKSYNSDYFCSCSLLQPSDSGSCFKVCCWQTVAFTFLCLFFFFSVSGLSQNNIVHGLFLKL